MAVPFTELLFLPPVTHIMCYLLIPSHKTRDEGLSLLPHNDLSLASSDGL